MLDCFADNSTKT